MMYLSSFQFPDKAREHGFFMGVQRTCYDSYYPFQVLAGNEPLRLDFAPITILYGGNGSGKSTALNVIGEKAGVQRDSMFNKSNFYPDYVDMCHMAVENPVLENSRIITSDDVFDYMLNIRHLNEGIDLRRDELFGEYLNTKYARFRFRSMEDYEALKRNNRAKSKTQSKFVRGELNDNIREFSNGESAFRYFIEKIGENGLYLLDEPENSLSPKRQLELAGFLEESARFFGCQFVIATHSPFLLAMEGARIYDLDEDPVGVKRWTELGNVRVYYEFFKAHFHVF